MFLSAFRHYPSVHRATSISTRSAGRIPAIDDDGWKYYLVFFVK